MEEQNQTIELHLNKKPKRSKFFTQRFKRTILVSNHFEIDIPSQMTVVYQYRFEFNPKIDSGNRKQIQSVMQECQELQKFTEVYGKTTYFSGDSLYSCKKSEQNLYSFKVEVQILKKIFNYEVQIEFVSLLKLDNDKNAQGYGNIITQVTNIELKNYMSKLNLVEMGKNRIFYNPNNLILTEEPKLKIMQGYYVSSKICINNKLKVLINPKSRIIRNETGLDFIRQISKYDLKGQCFMPMDGNQNLHRIDEVLTNLSAKDIIPNNKEGLTFLQYYLKNYNYKIQNENQPIFSHITKNGKGRFYFVPERCLMTGMIDKEKSNARTMKAIAQHTRLDPLKKFKQITEIADKIDQQSKQHQDQIKFNRKPEQVDGYILPKPKITIRNKNIEPSDNGIFKIRDDILGQFQLENWIVLFEYRNEKDAEIVEQIIDELQLISKDLGIKINDPGYIKVDHDFCPQQWKNIIQKDIDKYGRPQLILTLSINKRENKKLYDNLKQFILDHGEQNIPHQHALISSFFQKSNQINKSVCFSILKQMASKMGSVVWKVEIPDEIPKKTMLVGIDVYHKTSAGNKSAAGFIYSLDFEISNYQSLSNIQKQGQEMLQIIDEMFLKALNHWQRENGCLPECIIVYRDGVSQAQLEHVKEQEIKKIKQTFQQVKKNYNPLFAEIIVNKRINEKYFKQEKQLQNPQSGTIVCDNHVQDNSDFYLIAQNVNAGTCTPTHYTIISNSTPFSLDTFVSLTYWQCFNYMNWEGAVRVPAVTQYAHKLAYLIGENVKKDLNEKGKNLFFL